MFLYWIWFVLAQDLIAAMRSRSAVQKPLVLVVIAFSAAAIFATPSIAQSPVQPDFGQCNGRMWLSERPSSDEPTSLYEIDTTTNPFEFPIVGAGLHVYNATGYNPVDNYIYGIGQAGAGIRQLIRIGSDGSTVAVGPVGLGDSGGWLSGAFDPDGNYFIIPGQSTTNMQVVDVVNLSSSMITLSRSVDAFDIAWVNGLLYTVSISGQLRSINPKTGVVIDIGSRSSGGLFGALFGATNGLFGADNAGGLFQFDLTSGAKMMLSGSPVTGGSRDGGMCPDAAFALGADISVAQTNTPALGASDLPDDVYQPGELRTYTIVVSNAGPFGVQGARVLNQVPEGIASGTVTWTCGNEQNGGVCSEGSGAGGIDSAIDLPAGATLTFSLTLMVADSFAGNLVNLVQVVPPETAVDNNPADNTATDSDISAGEVALIKQLVGQSFVNDDVAAFNEELTYSLTLKNAGPSAVRGYNLTDRFDPNTTLVSASGPNTVAGTAITWHDLEIPPQVGLEPGELKLSVTIRVNDASEIPPGVTQISNLIFETGTEAPDCEEVPRQCVKISLARDGRSDVTVVKRAELEQVRRGQLVPFTIVVTNKRKVGPITMTVYDRLPAGFRYVQGSSSIDGVSVEPVIVGSVLSFPGLTLAPAQSVELRLQLLILNTVRPGRHTNFANATDAEGKPFGPDAHATVEVIAEAIFDCGEVIGKVFDDANRNGYRDGGEAGLPGVRVAAARGRLVMTDDHGRFHVPCADTPQQQTGSSFVMKVDPRTLPAGYRLTTENPRVVRLTAGKMTTLNFGAAPGRLVRLDLSDEAFLDGSLTLRKRWHKGLTTLIKLLNEEHTLLSLRYVGAGADHDFAAQRIETIRHQINRLRQLDGQHLPLEIETRVETGG